jgi:hypothetical protein
MAEAYSKGHILAEALPDMRKVSEALMAGLRGLAESQNQRKAAAHV